MPKPLVLMTCILPTKGMDLLTAHVELEHPKEGEIWSPKDIDQRIGDKAGLICTLSDTIDRTLLQHAPCLKIIANYAVGYNNIDITEASNRHIAVTNTPGVLTETTADLTFALILGIARRIVEADQFTRAGRFKRWDPLLMLGRDVYGKTIGIVGFGRIGKAVAQRARGFKMHVLYHEPMPIAHSIEKTYEAIHCDLETLLKESDYVCLHVPLTEQTHHMISERELSLMKPSAYLINVARGAVVDEQALIAALRNKTIAGCALDVYEQEPQISSELIQLSHTLLVPHIGSASLETRTRMAEMVAQNIIAVLIKHITPPNLVTPKV